MRITLEIDNRFKSVEKLIEFLKTLQYVKKIEIERDITDEDKIFLQIMKEDEKSGFLSEEESRKILGL